MKFLFSSTPGEGHVRPLLPLARGLAARDHEIVFVTAEEWAPRLEQEGFRVLTAGTDHATALRHVDPKERSRVPTPDLRLFLFPRLFGLGHAPAKVPELLAHARAWKPDAVVVETSDLSAPLVAAALGIPLVNHSFGTVLPRRVAEAAAEAVAPLWREHGLEPDPYAGAFRGLYVDVAPLSLSPAERPARTVGLRLVDRSPVPPPAPAGAEAPFVYATLGTVFNEPRLFTMLLEALDGLPALLTTGRGAAVDGPVPASVHVAEFLPQEDVLPHASAVLFHGGSGTMLGALAHGLPVAVLPQGADQFDNALACEAAGAGVALAREELDPAVVRAALERVLDDPSFAAAAVRIAGEIEEMPSAAEAAERVEEYAAAG